MATLGGFQETMPITHLTDLGSAALTHDGTRLLQSRRCDDTGAHVAALFASCQDAASQVRERREECRKAVCIARASPVRARFTSTSERNPCSSISLEKMIYLPETGIVMYLSHMHKGLKRNFQLMPGAQWLEMLCRHIPDRFEHLVRYVGWYSTRVRGERARAAASAVVVQAAEEGQVVAAAGRIPSYVP